MTKRYYAEGKLVATRTGALLTYVQSDHLGSSSTLTDASGSVIARERYSAFGERRRSDNLALTDRLYTGQRLNLISNLYHYTDGSGSGRFYDPLLARFVMADSVTPGKGSQPLNRYAYSFNNPVKFVDPDGHDAMFVGGYGGSDWEDPSSWKEWAMEYKGWTEDEWKTEFADPWEVAQAAGDDAAKQAVMGRTGIHIFNWTACGCGANSVEASRAATNDWAVGELDRQMEGMEDITLVGHSKGGNLIYNYISSDSHQHPIKNAVLIAAPIDNYLSGAVGLTPASSVLNNSARQSNVVFLQQYFDAVTVQGALKVGPVIFWWPQYIQGAINHIEMGADPHWQRSPGDIHAFHRNHEIASRTMMGDFSIIGDRNARTWSVR